MPTGYTSDIEKGITFNQFIMGCARAFGACVDIREESMDTPIPEEFKISPYHDEELAKAQKEYNKILKMSNQEIEKLQEKVVAEERKDYQNYIDKSNRLKAKYEEMLIQVEKWTPPSKDHIELKEFMIEQINSSIKFDCSGNYWKEQLAKVKVKSASGYKLELLKEVKWNIDYHTEESKKEKERVASRNKWVKQLRESLVK